MRKTLVAGNWKLNASIQDTEDLIKGILAGMDGVSAEVAVCPPYPYLMQAHQLLEGSAVRLGAQNVSDQDNGAYTGEVSAAMLIEVGCYYGIIGHSERRAYYAEDDAFIARKFVKLQAHDVVPILCVGETLEEREQGVTETVVATQLDAVIEEAGVAALANAVIAYEPVWAIGTGMTATREQAQEVHAFIRQRVAGHDAAVAEKVQILYGGSVKPDNAAELFAEPDIDGGLIGGASLKAEDFLGICRAGH